MSDKKNNSLEIKKPKRSKIGNFFYEAARLLVAIIYPVKIINRERVKTQGSYLICANHQSGADPIILCSVFPKLRLKFMAKKELFKIPLLSSLIRALGAFPIDRGGADVGAVKKSISYLEAGMSVGMFPQGTRHPHKDPKTTPVKSGVGMISIKSGTDVLPVFIWTKHGHPRMFRRSYVVVGEPISNEKLKDTAATATAEGGSVRSEYIAVSDLIFKSICDLEVDICQNNRK